MKWYTVYQGIELVNDNGSRRKYLRGINDSIDLGGIADTKREEAWGHSFWEHIKCILLLGMTYSRFIPLIAKEVKKQQEDRLNEIRRELGILNIGFRAETPFGGPHIDVYAESPEDAKRQLDEKRDAILGYYGIRVSEHIDDLAVRKCTCPRRQSVPIEYI